MSRPFASPDSLLKFVQIAAMPRAERSDGPRLCPNFRSESGEAKPPAEKLFGYELADVDLHAPIARLGDVVLGRHEELALAAARRLDALAGQTAFDQELAHAIGARARQLVIEVEGAHRVGMADHHDV